MLKRISRIFVYPRAHLLRIKNKIKYGPSAPRPFETIWVNPREVTMRFHKKGITKVFGDPKWEASGKVIKSDWPVDLTIPLFDSGKVKCALKHWVDGVPWEDTGIYERIEKIIRKRGRTDGCENRDDVIKRYQNLDSIFEQVKKEGRLRPTDGVIHLGPEGKPYYGTDATHRLIMAYVLNIPFPARIGLVHVSALPYLNDYRKEENVRKLIGSAKAARPRETE